MTLEKRYDPKICEPRRILAWQKAQVYHFEPADGQPVYSIDTPPPTVSGRLHLGHVYSYSHADFMARYFRMRGRAVFYPMGYDDNGLPTERLVEKRLGVTAASLGRSAFIRKCLEESEQAEAEYQALWQRLGLSIDWRYTYRTIDESSRRASQLSFIDLVRRGLAYRREAPAIWCPECRTSIAQAELNDLPRSTTFYTLGFRLPGGELLPIATTRPELLPACVAAFIHPDDPRRARLEGAVLTVPLFGRQVRLLVDPAADPAKGTGVVMCCTFGDQADLAWQQAHHLPVVEAIDREGRMTPAAGRFAGLPAAEARHQVIQALEQAGLLLGSQPLEQSVRVHERCDTPVEYILARQWFVRLLDHKQELLRLGEQVAWHPEHMQRRYQSWVENLAWDWCLSRQRFYGVPFPAWTCTACGEVMLADEADLPVDPLERGPRRPCACGSTDFEPDPDVMDTWATSSLSPQIAGQRLASQDAPGGGLYARVSPFSLRAQAHEIIRTWAFYTLVKSWYHFGSLPWKEVLISGWGLAGEGMGKISKSRGGGPMPPREMIEQYSADAVRYWAASTGAGRDAVISEEKIQNGARLVTKLWNVARFTAPFLDETLPPAGSLQDARLDYTLADRWLLARLLQVIDQATRAFEAYDYAAARLESENFFWHDLADNYIEMAKQRLYGEAGQGRDAARCTLRQALRAVLLLFAPLLPFVTDEIYQGLFADQEASIHAAAWPVPDPAWESPAALASGRWLLAAASAVRRYKSEHGLPLGSELARLQICSPDAGLRQELAAALPDLQSVCRAQRVEVAANPDAGLEILPADLDGITLGLL